MSVLVLAAAVACRRTEAPVPPAPRAALTILDARPEAPSTVDALAATSPACGEEHDLECPLQAFMNKRLNRSVKARKWREVASLFESLASVAPDGYDAWTRWAKEGLAAARAEDQKRVRTTCFGCHDAYQDRYRLEMRARPVPGGNPPAME